MIITIFDQHGYFDQHAYDRNKSPPHPFFLGVNSFTLAQRMSI